MRSIGWLASRLKTRPKAHLAVVLLAVTNHFTVVGLAAAPAALSVPAFHSVRSTCGPDDSCDRVANVDRTQDLSLPAGASQCHDSGPAAACSTRTDARPPAAGKASTPIGTNTCVPVAGKDLPTNAATCSESAIVPGTLSLTPLDTLGTVLPSLLTLSTTSASFRSGQAATLTATADSTITGTNLAIEIFDLTSATLIGACGQGSQCWVSYDGKAGIHEFAGFVTTPTTVPPIGSAALESNQLRVGWLDTAIAASQTIVGPGTPVTVTAASTLDVLPAGRWLEIYDLTAGARVTYCSRGNSCSTTMKMSASGVHKLVAYVTGTPEAVSAPIDVTWLGVSLSATAIGRSTTGTVWLKATANADLTHTPWVLGVYDERGRLVDHTCKGGTVCVVSAWMDGTGTPQYTAMIGALPGSQPGIIEGIARAVGGQPSGPLVDIQTKSATVAPTHLLWGVDSCKAIVGSPSGDLFWGVVRALGTPEFWGRYLTNTICPGIGPAETAIAAAYHMGILPIYNDYDCSAVQYYDTGHGYAVAAAAAAKRLGIPTGRAIAIDIEPAGAACPGAANVDSGFIEGWYDGIRQAGYVPVYYGNGTAGSAFASAWCSTVSALPNIATSSNLWSFEPSLLGSFSKVSNPGYSPYDPGCGGTTLAWQYVLSGGAVIDVDQDLALSSLPLWYPTS